ncbi:MAG: DUF934 domain-containing protein [Betaproteobacteria bacterium]|nr:DUF934 domain-containing protein [Betaproteobacteria bacterium]
MPELIRDHAIVQDSYLPRVTSLTGVDPWEDIIVSPDLLLAERDSLTQRPGKLGVWLETSDDPEVIAKDLVHLDLVVVHFPVFTDGRGHSTARLLREHYHYQGEIRAMGDVFKETLHYLARCGFNAFALRPGESPESALSGLDVFSEAYQTSVEHRFPLFRRRLVGATDTGKPS